MRMLEPLAAMLAGHGARTPGTVAANAPWVQTIIAPEVEAYRHGHAGFRFGLATRLRPAPPHLLLDVSVNTTPFEAFDILLFGTPLRLRSMGTELFNHIKMGSMCVGVDAPAVEKARQRRARTAYLLSAMRTACGEATFEQCMPAPAVRDAHMVRFYDHYAVLKHFRGSFGALVGVAAAVRMACDGRHALPAASVWAVGSTLLRRPPPAVVLRVQLREVPYTPCGRVTFDAAVWGGTLRVHVAPDARVVAAVAVPFSEEQAFVGSVAHCVAALDETFDPATHELIFAALPETS